MKRLAHLIFLCVFCLVCIPNSHAESGPGNGTDYVKVLFADAQYDLNRSFTTIESSSQLALVDAEPKILSWLETSNHFSLLKSYLRRIELRFQTEPCSDATRLPASICFYNEDPANPYVIVSLRENKMTTKEQAMAMLIHEAGHFVGETDHLFLDRMGVRLVQALKAPSILIADAESTEVVSNVFTAKEECERGTSLQAQTLVQRATQDLQIQCGQKKATCDLKKARFVYKGSNSFDRGESFDMKVKCAVRAVLDLRI